MLIDTLSQYQLLTPAQLAQIRQLGQGRCGEARALAKMMIQKGWLTVYQVNQLLAGNGKDLVIGPYHVIDKLGQGGLSSVFKARHSEYQTLVAIKMIRPEVFASPEGQQAFMQEVEAMARLDHVNIVQFCDADQFNDTFYFAMEYVEGTDLGKVVRLSGALPVREACDYIRQAALGLQHAYERNLIHRDIKPVNLFLTCHSTAVRHEQRRRMDVSGSKNQAKPLIKILDWGLASLRCPKGVTGEPIDDEAAKGIVGTADYLPPEQARNANTVDIRGDIYSLGCTFYYLLTGQAPFPDGTLMQKILAHQRAEPQPIEEFRSDVPTGVIAIVKRMMAKKPENRFQTPASVAISLLSLTRRPQADSSALLPTLKSVKAPATRDDTPLPATLAGKSNHDLDKLVKAGSPGHAGAQ